MLVLLALAWGTGFLFIKQALSHGLPPAYLIEIRTVIGAASAWLLVLAFERTPLRRRVPALVATPGEPIAWWMHLALGVFCIVPFWLLVWGEQFVSSSVAGIVNSSDPLWTALLLMVITRRLDRRVAAWAGLAVGFGGVSLLTWSQVDGMSTAGDMAGVLAVAGSAALYALLGIFVALYARRSSPLRLTAWGLTWASVMVSYYLLLQAPLDHVSATALWNAVALGVVDTAIGYALFYLLVAWVGPLRTSLVVYLMPLVAVACGRIFRDEALTPIAVAATVLVLLGVWIAGRAPAVEEPEVAEATEPAVFVTAERRAQRPIGVPIPMPDAPGVPSGPGPATMHGSGDAVAELRREIAQLQEELALLRMQLYESGLRTLTEPQPHIAEHGSATLQEPIDLGQRRAA